MTIPDSLANKLALFRERCEVKPYSGDLFGDISWFAILYGQGLTPEGYHPLADVMSQDDLELTLARIRGAIKQRVDSLPTHSAFIEGCCAARPATTAA
jgi:tryptophan halogenase